MAWTVISAYALDQVFGYQGGNKLRENAIALAARRSGRFLGGSRHIPNDVCISIDGRIKAKSYGLGPADVYNYRDVEIDGTAQGGITYQARVEVRVSNPSLSLTPKIRNVTDGSDAGTGVACSATPIDYSGTNQKQTIALTIPTGVKKYRLMFTLSNLSFESWASGEIESFATA